MATFKLEDGTEIEAFTADELKQRLDSEVAGLKENQAKLLDEAKAAKQRAAELEQAQKAAEEEALKKSGEFQKLYESETEKANRLSRELEEKEAMYREKEKVRQQKEIGAEAIKLASGVAVDETSLELLAEKAQQFAVFTEEGVQYEIGGVRVEPAKVVETLATKYPRLVKGSGATGGGAAGGKGGGASTDTNTKAAEAKAKGDVHGFLAAHLASQ